VAPAQRAVRRNGRPDRAGETKVRAPCPPDNRDLGAAPHAGGTRTTDGRPFGAIREVSRADCRGGFRRHRDALACRTAIVSTRSTNAIRCNDLSPLVNRNLSLPATPESSHAASLRTLLVRSGGLDAKKEMELAAFRFPPSCCPPVAGYSASSGRRVPTTPISMNVPPTQARKNAHHSHVSFKEAVGSCFRTLVLIACWIWTIGMNHSNAIRL